MNEQDKARERARLMIAWADGRTLQRSDLNDKWTDYTYQECPKFIYPEFWRIKPEPRGSAIPPDIGEAKDGEVADD
jgi:hypothetical protein